jgi:hypothetical protein
MVNLLWERKKTEVCSDWSWMQSGATYTYDAAHGSMCGDKNRHFKPMDVADDT